MTLISRKYIDDNDIVARYLANQLSEAERESFEAYYLDHPELQKELHRTAQFKSGLIDLKESGALQELLNSQPWWRYAGSIAVAASLLLAVIGGGFWFTSQIASRPLLASSVVSLSSQFQSTLPLAGSFEIQRTRTSSYDATIKLPTNSAAIELRIKPEVQALPARYRISFGVVSGNGAVSTLYEIGAVQPQKDGFVPVYLNASKLTPAIYEVKISGDADQANIASSFLIELVGRNAR